MYRFWKFFIENSKFSYLLIVALTGFGLFSVFTIAKESSPEVQIPIGIVTTVLAGASAEDIESLVTNKVEQGLAGNLDNLKKLTSTSREGVSSVVAEFEAEADIDDSIQELKDEVDKIVPDLPDEAEDPIVSEVNFVDQPIMNVAVSGDLGDAEFTDLAEELENELEGISGVSRVETTGVREREVTIAVDQASLVRFNMSINDVVGGISRANTTFPVGVIETDGVAYNIAFEGDIEETHEIADIPLVVRGGQPVYVRDIATIDDSLAEARTISRLSVNGEPSVPTVSLNVFKQRGGDITRIAENVNARLLELQAEGGLLEGLTVVAILDSGADIKTDLVRLTRSGLQTVTLVVILLVIAIGWREGLVAGTAIPLSFLIGFIGLNLSGNTVNFVSLFALILAVGILVDSAIVMVEGINRRMKEDPTIDKRDAARLTIKEFNVPLTTGTLTTVAMFSGLFLVSGVSGQFISAIPFTINFVLFASLLVALGFIPIVASLILRRRTTSYMDECQQKYSHMLEDWYRRTLDSFLQNRKKKIIFVAGIVIAFFITLSFPFTGLVKVIFFEQEDIEWIFAEIELPQGTVQNITDVASRRLEEVLYAEPNIESFVITVGASSAFADNSGSSVDNKFASAFITLRDDRDVTSTELVEILRPKLATIEEGVTSVGQPNGGPPTGAPIVVKFLGDDLTELTAITLQAAEVLRDIPGTTNIDTSTKDNSTEFVLTLDKAKASALGLDPFTVSQTLRTAVYGSDATEITSPKDDIDVVVKLALNSDFTDVSETNDTTIDVLENITIPLPSGDSVLLSSLVDTSLRESSSVINHEDQKRIISLSSNVTGSGNVREVNAEFIKQVDEKLDLPSDVSFTLGGEDEESNQAFREMLYALVVGVVLMLAILVLQFNSYRHTFYVLSILPFSLIGIMVGLAITGKSLSFPSIMGFIALSGIVVNNSILLIDQMNNNRKRNPDGPVRKAVVDAAVSRFRPILLTTLTTVIGITPLIFASDLWSPLAFCHYLWSVVLSNYHPSVSSDYLQPSSRKDLRINKNAIATVCCRACPASGSQHMRS